MQKVRKSLTFTATEQRLKRLPNTLVLANNVLISLLISLSSDNELSIMCPKYLNWLTVSNEQLLRVNAGKDLAIILPLSEGWKIIQTVFLVLNVMFMFMPATSTARNRHCKALHDGASKTISSAYASKLTLMPAKLQPIFKLVMLVMQQ